jgi:photosystem II Psb27 protein|tara:strand:+ start:2355 stop:2795 length:441 start_codon:yes stop_codon:yes gene_type:complete
MNQMNSALHHMSKQLMRAALALCLGLCLMLTTFAGADAAEIRLSGTYVEDTVNVAHSLQETIAIPMEDEGHAAAAEEAHALIYDYIAKYRPRPKVNNLPSFTTMQTALNSLAGHYNNFANRPLPEELQTRINKELAKAEQSALRGS